MTARRDAAAGTGQLHAELAEARAEIAELRTQLRAVAALAAGIGFRTAPATTGGAITTIRQLALINNLGPDRTETLIKLFG